MLLMVVRIGELAHCFSRSYVVHFYCSGFICILFKLYVLRFYSLSLIKFRVLRLYPLNAQSGLRLMGICFLTERRTDDSPMPSLHTARFLEPVLPFSRFWPRYSPQILLRGEICLLSGSKLQTNLKPLGLPPSVTAELNHRKQPGECFEP